MIKSQAMGSINENRRPVSETEGGNIALLNRAVDKSVRVLTPVFDRHADVPNLIPPIVILNGQVMDQALPQGTAAGISRLPRGKGAAVYSSETGIFYIWDSYLQAQAEKGIDGVNTIMTTVPHEFIHAITTSKTENGVRVGFSTFPRRDEPSGVHLERGKIYDFSDPETTREEWLRTDPDWKGHVADLLLTETTTDLIGHLLLGRLVSSYPNTPHVLLMHRDVPPKSFAVKKTEKLLDQVVRALVTGDTGILEGSLVSAMRNPNVDLLSVTDWPLKNSTKAVTLNKES